MDRITDEWLENDATQTVLKSLSRVGHQAFAVGGCVRNALLGLPASDIDISTSATPEEVTRLFGAAGYKVIPTGFDHGTVTVVIDGVALEVTTFRRDVETDGRHAVVQFSTSLVEDARRRDFTMNALYADYEGVVHDPLGGLADLRQGHVCFIEDATQRIREDYLRSLRFFRFYAYYGDHGEGPDPEALAAIAGSLDGLDGLAKERVGSEVLKLLAAPDPAPATAAMQSTGVLQRVLPGADPQFLAPLVHLETYARIQPDPIRRLASLGGQNVEKALRLSSKKARRLAVLREFHDDLGETAYRHDPSAAWDTALLIASVNSQPLSPDTALQIERGSGAIFPISAADLMPEFHGKLLGDQLAVLERHWIASGFELEKEELLSLVAKKE